MRPSARLGWLAPAAMVVSLAACTHRPMPPSPPPAPSAPAAAGLRVTLVWAGPADLDLYVTGPSWETVYFGNTPSKSGGTLEHDARCAVIPSDANTPQVEAVSFVEPDAGHYRVGVDYLEACREAAGEPVGYRVITEFAGARNEYVGLAHHHQFVPIVLEFDLRAGAPNSPLTLVVTQQPEVTQ